MLLHFIVSFSRITQSPTSPSSLQFNLQGSPCVNTDDNKDVNKEVFIVLMHLELKTDRVSKLFLETTEVSVGI